MTLFATVLAASLCLGGCAIPSESETVLTAFPGAEGFGAASLGGRGDGSQIPQVFAVDTLEDVVADDGRQFC